MLIIYFKINLGSRDLWNLELWRTSFFLFYFLIVVVFSFLKQVPIHFSCLRECLLFCRKAPVNVCWLQITWLFISMRLRIIAGCSRLCVHISSARNLSRNLQPLSEHYVGLFIHLTFLLRRLWDDLSGLSPLLDKLSLKCSVRWFQRAKSCRVIIYMIYSNRLTKSKMLQIHAIE